MVALSSLKAGMKTSRKATSSPGRDSGNRMRRTASHQERSGDAARLLQRRVDLAEGGIGAARRQRHEARDIGREQDPDRAVDRDRQANEGQQDADGHHRARQAQRQDGEIVEQAAPANVRAQIEIGDGRADDAPRSPPRRLRA